MLPKLVCLALAGLSSLVIDPPPLQPDPVVPCVGCPGFAYPPFPNTGMWYNPVEAGTGFQLEVQNGILAGSYFLFEKTGEPVWYQFSGRLQPGGEQSDAHWRLEADLRRFDGGTCMNCPYDPDAEMEIVGRITLEFDHRHAGRFSVDGGRIQPIVPFNYGASGTPWFREQTAFRIPALDGIWSVTTGSGDPTEAGRYESRAVRLQLSPDAAQGRFRVRMTAADSPAENARTVGDLACTVDQEVPGPVCQITWAPLPDHNFYMSIADIGATRIYAEAADGTRLIANRLDFD